MMKNPWAFDEWAKEKKVASTAWAWANEAFVAGYELAISEGAQEMGKRGGQAKSKRKAAASRSNGAKGGRPKKRKR
jgi:hypothetical protein